MHRGEIKINVEKSAELHSINHLFCQTKIWLAYHRRNKSLVDSTDQDQTVKMRNLILDFTVCSFSKYCKIKRLAGILLTVFSAVESGRDYLPMSDRTFTFRIITEVFVWPYIMILGICSSKILNTDFKRFHFYAPVSKNWGAYCFTVVRLSVRPSVRLSAQT